MKNCGIYKITNPKGRIYIGQSYDCMSRSKRYARMHCKKQSKLFASMNKYGWQNHKFEIIHKCKKNMLNHWEAYYIYFFDTFNTVHGLNLREGGNQRWFVSDETKEKLRILGTERKFSKETIEKITKNLTGREVSKETRLKISASRTGIKMNDKFREKIRELNELSVIGMKGKKHSPETIEKMKLKKVSPESREKIRKTLTGRKRPSEVVKKIKKILSEMKITAWNKGIPCSDSTKEKLSIANIGKINTKTRIPVSQYTLDMIHVKDYDGVCAAMKETEIFNINRAAKKNRSAGGFLWKYKNK